MSQQSPQFHPFFDPWRGGKPLRSPEKISIALLIGGGVTALQYFSVADKQVFFDQESWIMGAIISTCILALFLAAELLRSNLELIEKLTSDARLNRDMQQGWLGDRAFILAGVMLGTVTVLMSFVFGIPTAFLDHSLSLFSLQLAYFTSGFTMGLGAWGVLGVIVLYLKLAPKLPHALDPRNPDGLGGIKKLGDSLWFFALLTICVGMLGSTYLFSVDWTGIAAEPVRSLFLVWLSLPFVLSISIVLIPGLVMRRQVSYFKAHRSEQLRQEKARLYASYKKFQEGDDEDIIADKRDIQGRMEQVQEQMEQLRRMRDSHLDRIRKS